MKRIVVLFLLLVTCRLTYANEEDKIKDVVNKWNQLHNNADVNEFLDLYADEVYFYGRYNTKLKCYNQKAKFLGKDFSQQIITSIKIQYHNSDIIKCDFTKQTSFKGKIRQHRCYLLLEKVGDKYVVSGESDYETDGKLDVTPDLDKSSAWGKYFLFAGLIAAIVVTISWYKKKHKIQSPELSNYPTPHEPLLTTETTTTPVLSTRDLIEKAKNELLEELRNSSAPGSLEAEKGLAFEKYIVAKFDKTYFTLTEWRSDKYHDGVYAKSSHLPDLEYEFSSASFHMLFAIECKWRASFANNQIEWAKDHQLVNYKQYEGQKNIPVFIIIGIGGSPSQPKEVYILPLKEINRTVLSFYDMKKYNRFKTGNFYLNPQRMILE